ncbi:toxin SymE, type I toxin-antitoxin system family protein [Pluralibacter gergoviae]|uniref:Toxin SymE, type I toxin-antitoxin system family protein n=1 Tax=Pluralibacter gergoviae TaxID=61647 RepID=A0AAI9DRT4_PLUGE|nr:toxin SymE, type I toxin-antitoxin system family protein [Pluralibacter gergoviae]EKV0918672.1 toxin SymE, type I toxin-antitoxin system family protein [Pluralibacter gergoviae]EKV9911408.1 toxin SymE, type I toxin-antitoxin system family protein [Pluralibacter gergoviae]EKW7277414.1 toxin SymE, type I toxin-antitoxin system family protein [Pluralibacter gergoviae]ELD4298812.1 toxin SymE, type I toxin-antitoxin system family protein [Pluralibacter gergoviae]ELD4309586.1 toxin SymE, type I t
MGYLPSGSGTPLIKLIGKWLRDEEFNTATGITVKIAGDCIVLILDSPQEQALREQLEQVKNMLNRVKQNVTV